MSTAVVNDVVAWVVFALAVAILGTRKSRCLGAHRLRARGGNGGGDGGRRAWLAVAVLTDCRADPVGGLILVDHITQDEHGLNINGVATFGARAGCF